MNHGALPPRSPFYINIKSLDSCRCLQSRDLFSELLERWRTLRHFLFSVCLYLLGSEHVVVEQELSHELVTVVSPQVCIGVERRAVVGRTVHYQRHVIHQLRSHVRQLLHVLQVRLQPSQHHHCTSFTVVERLSLTSKLSLSYARPMQLMGDHLCG